MPSLAADEVHVFVVRVPAGPPRDDALSADERRRAAGYRREEDRWRFVAARQALREILAEQTGTPASRIVFTTRCARCGDPAHGKPALADPVGSPIRFSASRSGELALVAVARGREVGVDVERMRPDIEHREIAARFFGPAEQEGGREGLRQGLGEGLSMEAFYAAWARKEAVLKLAGVGLAGDLAAAEPLGSWVVPVPVPEGYAAALAAEGPPGRLVVRTWD